MKEFSWKTVVGFMAMFPLWAVLPLVIINGCNGFHGSEKENRINAEAARIAVHWLEYIDGTDSGGEEKTETGGVKWVIKDERIPTMDKKLFDKRKANAIAAIASQSEHAKFLNGEKSEEYAALIRAEGLVNNYNPERFKEK